MRTRATRLLLAAALGVALLPAAAHTQHPTPPHHVRADQTTAHLLRALLAHSPTARDLVDRVDESDAIVYIRTRWFSSATLRGRIGCLSANPQQRLLEIELSAHLNEHEQMVILGHELQHATEIAGALGACSPESLIRLYRRIGDMTSDAGGTTTFETSAATLAADRVRLELTQSIGPAAVADDDRN